MLAAFSDLFAWYFIPLVILFLATWIFGISGLLYVGVRFIAKSRKATYWRSVGTVLLIGLCSTIGGLVAFIPFAPIAIGLFVAWLLIMAMFKISFGKAILAWLPMFGGQLFIITPLLVAILLPSLNRAREYAKRAVCESRLNGLGVAMQLYHESENAFPPSPKEFVEEGYASSKNFECPSDTLEREVSYFYLPPLETDDGETFVMCDLKGNHENFRNVLRRRGDVEHFSEEAFQAELLQPYNTRFAAALKKAEGP